MTPEERALLQQLKTDVDKIKAYTTSLEGNLEFKRTIERLVKEAVDLEINGSLKHTGSKIGFFKTTPTTQQASISDPSGGATQDANARTAINSILDVLDAYGLTA